MISHANVLHGGFIFANEFLYKMREIIFKQVSFKLLISVLYLLNWSHRHINEVSYLTCGIGIHLTGKGYLSRCRHILENNRSKREKAIPIALCLPALVDMAKV